MTTKERQRKIRSNKGLHDMTVLTFGIRVPDAAEADLHRSAWSNNIDIVTFHRICTDPTAGATPPTSPKSMDFVSRYCVLRGGVDYAHLRRFISSGLLSAATFRKPPTYLQKLIHSYHLHKF
uniref:Uncharacterized protein n=1 Tax=Megaselia scalaris TaxID=36166 RepID=T1H5E8_MEGSC